MSQVTGFDPSANSEQSISNYSVYRSWITNDQKGTTVNTYNKGNITDNKNIVSESVPFSMYINEPISNQPITMPYQPGQKPLCEQYKCADTCSKNCVKMNCYKRPNLKK